MTATAEFLVELYVAREDREAAWRAASEADRAAADLTREGRPVRCVRFVFVPEDETCLLLLEASSAEVVQAALARAGLPFVHISSATTCEIGPN